MDEFEARLGEVRSVVEKYVRFKLCDSPDAEDVLQEVYTLAYLKYDQLNNPEAFKAWLLTIARSRCSDYFRSKQRRQEVSLEEVPEVVLSYGRQGITVSSLVEETMEKLEQRDRELLRMIYWEELPQNRIAQRLGIPLGTVKSRLHKAKERFRFIYPYSPGGEKTMTKLPKIMPEYTIEKMDKEPFPVRWEELQGWMLVPREGEKLSWGLYDAPAGKRTEYTDMKVVGKAEVHGIDGVEIVAVQYDAEDYYRTGSLDQVERRFIAQLTDTHSRYLAESHMEDGVRKCYTFLDGEAFLNNWGFGPDNIGNEVNLAPKGLLKREGDVITGTIPREVMDVVGRYRVTINGKAYDTICVMDIECFNDAVASEQFLDENGRTILWRRFNRDDWAIDRFGGKLWSEKLPDNERLTINGQTYVHWYDCISDYIL